MKARAARAPVTGTVYLLHFDRAYRHARHYVGYTDNLPRRLEEHREGTGARLMEVVKDAGISFTLARTWPGDRATERRKKRQGSRALLCPLCRAQLALPLAGGAQ